MDTTSELITVEVICEHEMKELFVSCIAELGCVHSVYRKYPSLKYYYRQWIASDPQFKADIDEAFLMFKGRVFSELLRRAVEGVPRKKFFKGEPVIDPETGKHYQENEYSDKLLLSLMEVVDERFRPPKAIQHSGGIGIEHSGQLVTTRIIENDDWYGTKSAATNGDAPQGDVSSVAGDSVSSTIQGSGLRATLGQDCTRTDDGTEGPRGIQGPETGGD